VLTVNSRPIRDFELLVTVKAYPSPSRAVQESSCTAGLTSDGEWIRLFPLNWRALNRSRRFAKYDWIRVSAFRSRDQRSETWVPIPESIQQIRNVGTGRNWDERKRLILPRLSSSIEELEEKHASSGVSLGLIRPSRIDAFVIEDGDAEWSEERAAVLAQLRLFDQTAAASLTRVPFKFSYRFACERQPCRQHKMMTVDWEVAESYRKWSKLYPNDWRGRMKKRYEDELVRNKEPYFYVGTMFLHPATWIILGNFAPPRTLQATLISN
jgi:hypothetical protein